jgi:hypothetical protein
MEIEYESIDRKKRRTKKVIHEISKIWGKTEIGMNETWSNHLILWNSFSRLYNIILSDRYILSLTHRMIPYLVILFFSLTRRKHREYACLVHAENHDGKLKCNWGYNVSQCLLSCNKRTLLSHTNFSAWQKITMNRTNQHHLQCILFYQTFFTTIHPMKLLVNTRSHEYY